MGKSNEITNFELFDFFLEANCFRTVANHYRGKSRSCTLKIGDCI